jgi:hypothetical protein
MFRSRQFFHSITVLFFGLSMPVFAASPSVPSKDEMIADHLTRAWVLMIESNLDRAIGYFSTDPSEADAKGWRRNIASSTYAHFEFSRNTYEFHFPGKNGIFDPMSDRRGQDMGDLPLFFLSSPDAAARELVKQQLVDLFVAAEPKLAEMRKAFQKNYANSDYKYYLPDGLTALDDILYQLADSPYSYTVFQLEGFDIAEYDNSAIEFFRSFLAKFKSGPTFVLALDKSLTLIERLDREKKDLSTRPDILANLEAFRTEINAQPFVIKHRH